MNRRGFLQGLASLFAAPAIVRIEALMPVIVVPPAPALIVPNYNTLLTINMITREATRLFRNSNWFIRTIGQQFDEEFASTGYRVREQLRLKLPHEYAA